MTEAMLVLILGQKGLSDPNDSSLRPQAGMSSQTLGDADTLRKALLEKPEKLSKGALAEGFPRKHSWKGLVETSNFS